jgi:phosphoribosylformylglycinamidine synthase subunit PurS
VIFVEFTVEVRVCLKKGALDAEGETVRKSLGLLGYDVSKVETVKVYRVVVEAKSKAEAVSVMDGAAKRLLANPVIQEYSVTVV